MLDKVFLVATTIFLLAIGYYFISSIYRPNTSSGAVPGSAPIIASDSDELAFSRLSIEYLRAQDFDSEEPTIIEALTPGINYNRYIATYLSEGLKINALLTVPLGDMPEGGYSAIVFNHGYIPPTQYITTEKYLAYTDYLARNGFVVFKIDMRGHGISEGSPTGSYFSPSYTIDAISALKSLQKLDYINPNKIGMWGHSMSGNLTLRAMLVEPDIKAGVIWGGAVYSYEDFAKYRISDNSFVRTPGTGGNNRSSIEPEYAPEVQKIRDDSSNVDFNNAFWKSISLTNNISYLSAPLQLHHSMNDDVVDIGYSRDLASVLQTNNKSYELFEYLGGGHNINSPYFEQAMLRTVEFFKENLNN